MSNVTNRPGGEAPKRRTGLIVGVALAAAAVIAAAIIVPQVVSANNTATPTDAASETPAAEAEYTLVTAGTLTVATEGTYKPFSYHDESGELVGYDVEVAKAVAEKLGLEVEFAETEWAAIFAGLEGQRFDVIANQVSINEEREAKYLLSDPYTISPGALIVKSDNTTITGFDDLEGKKAAQSATSNWHELATSYGAVVEDVEGWNESVTLLRDGRIDFTLNDKLTFLDFVATEGADDISIVAETDDPSRSAFALTKTNEKLTADINAALAELSDDGTLAKIGEKYFGEDVSK
jgi:L-cystine transport system substrate-binding protein